VGSDKAPQHSVEHIDDNLAMYVRKDDSTHEEGELQADTPPK
jgi:hypothetical protein